MTTKTIVLTTRHNFIEPQYRINEIGLWQPIKFDKRKFKNIRTAFIYFSKYEGIRRKIKILEEDGRIVYSVLEKIINSITIGDLRQNKIITRNDNLEGPIRYLISEKSKILNEIWNERYESE